MDNLTHTLAGLAVGQAAATLRGRKQLRLPFWTVSAAANNFPDLDFLYAPVTEGRLGYVLHHRGHTHTLVMALPQALLLLGLVLLWKRLRKGNAWSRADWTWLAGLSVLGPMLHVFMDWCNSYGVHPFWPFDNRWYYGDFIFIIEPWFWVTFAPLLFWEATSRFARALLALPPLLAVGLSAWTGFVPWWITVFLGGWAAWFFVVLSKLSSRARAAFTFGAVAAAYLVFAVAASAARTQTEAVMAADFPKDELQDLALSPMPANPFCWMVHAVSIEGPRYLARHGMAALAPRLIGASECPDRPVTEPTFPRKPVTAPARPELVWTGQFEGPLAELQALAAGHCGFRGLLRFARVPAWTREGNRYVVGDLRFDRRGGRDFPELELGEAKAMECPKLMPPWMPPREALLRSAATSP